jgi:hypothetical protein
LRAGVRVVAGARVCGCVAARERGQRAAQWPGTRWRGEGALQGGSGGRGAQRRRGAGLRMRAIVVVRRVWWC